MIGHQLELATNEFDGVTLQQQFSSRVALEKVDAGAQRVWCYIDAPPRVGDDAAVQLNFMSR